MNLQARKLDLIQYLIQLQDVNEFSRIEASIIHKKKNEKSDFKPFTAIELIERAKKSNDDYEAGRVKTQEQLATESENW